MNHLQVSVRVPLEDVDFLAESSGSLCNFSRDIFRKRSTFSLVRLPQSVWRSCWYDRSVLPTVMYLRQ